MCTCSVVIDRDLTIEARFAQFRRQKEGKGEGKIENKFSK